MRTMPIVFSIALLLSLSIHASKVLPFIDRDFKSFVNKRVAGPEREKFANYMGKVNARMSRLNDNEKEKLAKDLRTTALDAMGREHSAWAHDINAFLNDVKYLDSTFETDRLELCNFLNWYGALAKFHKQSPKTRVARVDSKRFTESAKEFFGTVGVKLSQTKDKIGDWFKSLKTKLT